MLILLKQNLFKNVSEGPDFLWQTQIGLNDTIPKKKEWSYKDTFSNDFGAQSDFSQTFVREKLVPWNHSYLKYALGK